MVFDKYRVTVEYIIVELKKTKLKDGKAQIKSYCNATGAPIGVWSNGEQYSFYNRKDPNYFNDAQVGVVVSLGRWQLSICSPLSVKVLPSWKKLLPVKTIFAFFSEQFCKIKPAESAVTAQSRPLDPFPSGDFPLPSASHFELGEELDVANQFVVASLLKLENALNLKKTAELYRRKQRKRRLWELG